MFPIRVLLSKEFFPKKHFLVFGTGHYVTSESEDEFSKKLVHFYKYGYYKDYFFALLLKIYELRFRNDEVVFDYVTLLPESKKGGVNTFMMGLVKEFSEKTKIPYKQLLNRKKTIKKNHDLDNYKERIENNKGSIELLEEVKNKNIMVLDNTIITGSSMTVVIHELKKNNANEIVGLCLGLSNKEKAKDWVDVNKTLKYSRIKKICRSPFVSKEEREEWKKKLSK